MKRIIKEKVVEIILGLLLSLAILFTGFYYNTQNDLNFLKTDTSNIHEQVDSLEERMNKSDIQVIELKTDVKYIIQMLQEIKDDINE